MISDTLIQALIKKNTPEPLRTQVVMQTFADFPTLRETVEAFAQQMVGQDRKSTENKFGPDAMEVDAFGK